MFDWDKDVEELVTGEAQQNAQKDTTVVPPRRSNDMFVPGLGLVGVALIGMLAYVGYLPWTITTEASTADFVPFHASHPVMADVTLQALDQAQSNRFQIELRSLSDADLLRYAATAKEDLVQAVAYMRPNHADAVTLIKQELQRRGL